MKLILAFAVCLVNALCALGATVPDVSPTEYTKLYSLCQSGGPSTYVGVRYAGGHYITFNHGECYPYDLNGNLIEMTVYCQPATCSSYPNPNCTGGAVPPVPIPVAQGMTLANANDFVQIFGQSTACQPSNGLQPPL